MSDTMPPDTERDTRPSVWAGTELPPTAQLIVSMSDRVLTMNEHVLEVRIAIGEVRESQRHTSAAVTILSHDVARVKRTLDDISVALAAIATAVGVDLPPPLRLVGGDHGAE